MNSKHPTLNGLTPIPEDGKTCDGCYFNDGDGEDRWELCIEVPCAPGETVDGVRLNTHVIWIKEGL